MWELSGLGMPEQRPCGERELGLKESLNVYSPRGQGGCRVHMAVLRGCAFVLGPMGSHGRDLSRGGPPSDLKSREGTEGDGPGHRWIWVEQTNGDKRQWQLGPRRWC